jgi:hypothetical protein
MQLPPTLDAEFRRVAREEQKSREALVAEVAALTHKSERQIYNYRSGKWSLPADLIPALCRRFRSRALLAALEEQCREVEVDVPNPAAMVTMVSRTIREDLDHYQHYLDAFEDGVIQPRELRDIRERAERVIRNLYQFVAIAAAQCERRNESSMQTARQ